MEGSEIQGSLDCKLVLGSERLEESVLVGYRIIPRCVPKPAALAHTPSPIRCLTSAVKA